MTLSDRTRGRAWALVVALAAMTSSAQALGLFAGGSTPSIVSPSPIPFVVMSWLLGPLSVPMLAGLLSLAWCVPLLRGSAVVPRRTLVLAALVGVSSFTWYLYAILRPLNSAGPAYTTITATASLLLLVATLTLAVVGRKRPGLGVSALAHLFLFSWLFSYAFTWFGEVP